MRYEIELAGVDSRQALHERLRQTLPLPAWYGDNLDALHDALSEGEGCELIFRNAALADGSMEGYLASLRRLCDELADERPDILIAWEDGGASPYLRRVDELCLARERHYNCAQKTLIPFAPGAGLDEETAYAVAANFGGGMKRASVCGAIAGGLMALGLYGLDDPGTVGEYYRRLRASHDGLFDCADLLRTSRERGEDRRAHCDGMVRECAALVEALMRSAGKIE